MTAITADTKDLKKMTKFLRKNSRNSGAVAIAIQHTLNDLAFDTRKRVVEHSASKVMTVRKKTYVKRSMAIKKIPRGKKIKDMESRMGALEKKDGKKLLGWKEMEKGSKVRSPYGGKHGYHATLYARGGSAKGKVRAKRRIGNMNMISNKISRNPAKTPNQRAKQTIAVMIRTKERRPFHLTFSGKKGLFQIVGKRLKKLYAVGKKKYSLKKRKWLEPASTYTMKSSEELYKKNASKQIERLSKKLGIKYRS